MIRADKLVTLLGRPRRFASLCLEPWNGYRRGVFG